MKAEGPEKGVYVRLGSTNRQADRELIAELGRSAEGIAFDDRIEIENPGILLPGMTFEDMRQGVSKIRNHVIARIFRELNLIEQWGSGIPRIFREAEELGLPDLRIIEIGMRIRFTIPLAEQVRIQEATEQVTEQLTEQVRRVLLCLKDGPLGARDAMQSIGLRHRPTFLYV